MPWHWCACPAKKRNRPGRCIESASSSSTCARCWKRRGAVFWSITGWSRFKGGGKKRAFATLPAPEWIKELLGNSQPVVLLLQEKIDQLTRQLQNAANAEPPRGLGKMTSVIIEGRGSTPLSDYVQHRLIQLPICRVYHERHYRAALLIHDEHNSDISLDGASILDDRPRNQFFCDLRADISAVVAKNRQF